MVLKNYMENLISDNLDSVMEMSRCCRCEHCRLDVLALALNALPSQYVVTPKGEVYAKAKDLALQYHADIIAAISRACAIVTRSPRHDASENET